MSADPKSSGLDVSVLGAMTEALDVEGATIARMQVAGGELSTGVVELLGSLDGRSWAPFVPAVELSSTGITAPVVVAGLRYIRARVKTAESLPTVVTITLWGDDTGLLVDRSLRAEDVAYTAANPGHWRTGANPGGTSGSVRDALDDAARMIHDQWPAVVPGKWWFGNPHGYQRTWSDSWTLTLGANRVYVHPFYVPWACTLTDAFIRIVTGQPGANGKLVLFRNDTWSGDSLLYEGGELDFSSAGSKSESGLSITCEVGWYWFGVHNETANVATACFNRYYTRIAEFGTSIGATSYASVYGDQTYPGAPDPFVFAAGASTSYATAAGLKVAA